MDQYDALLKLYPAYVSKEQFRLIAHISKRTARCLLLCGVVPCEDNGKKTRNYNIKMSDVVAYLRDRELYPQAYSPANYLHQLEPTKHKCGRKTVISGVDIAKYREYLLTTMKAYPDVMSIDMVGEYIGYTRNSVAKWVGKGTLKAFHYTQALLFPKEYLIDFMVAEHGLPSARASAQYKEIVQGFHSWKLRHR